MYNARSTNLERVMYTLDHLSAQTDSNKIGKGTARNNATFNKKFSTVESFELEFKSYRKFLFVRETLVRLLSAYRDKVTRVFFQSNKITFKDFLEKILAIPGTETDRHLISFTRMCQPCSIKYDFIDLVHSYGEDMRRILDSVNATKYVTLPERNQTGYMTEKSSEVLQSYLKDIPTSLIKRIYENYYWDYFLFGFTKPDF